MKWNTENFSYTLEFYKKKKNKKKEKKKVRHIQQFKKCW